MQESGAVYKMTSLNIASKANQATIFPALLVASYVKKISKDASLDINFNEVESLKSGENASIELLLGSTPPTYGSEKAICDLIKAFSFLQGKNDNLVGTV